MNFGQQLCKCAKNLNVPHSTQTIFESSQRPDGQPFLADDILDLLERQPELLRINQSIVDNEGLIKSTTTDVTAS